MTVMIPMQDREGVREYFDLVWSSTSPLEPNDFICVIDEINATCKRSYPKWKRRLPLWCVPISFVIVCLVGALIAGVAALAGTPLSPYWHREVFAVAVLMATLAIFFGRWLQPRMKQRMLAALRRNLVHLNSAYIGRGVDFQLHETTQLDLYLRTSGAAQLALRHQMENLSENFSCHVGDAHHHRAESSDYILVVQFTLGMKNEKWIPAPDVLRVHGEPVWRPEPSAPLVATPAL